MDSRLSQMLEMRKKKYTLLEIGNKFGITKERVRQIITRTGLIPKRFPPREIRKVCLWCKKTKILKVSGLLNARTNIKLEETRYCSRQCTTASTKKSIEEKRASRRQKKREWYKTPKGQAYSRKQNRLQYKKNPEKVKARTMVNIYLKKGAITRPEECSQCKTKEFLRLEAHHTDYSKPLYVHWLCTVCHGAVHKGALTLA